MFQLPIFHILWNLQGPTCWRDAYFTSEITLNFIHNLYDLVFWLKYFIYYMFQILHFTFLHLKFWFICENLHPHLFVIRYSITLLAHFIYEYIFTLLITFYLWIYDRWIFSSNIPSASYCRHQTLKYCSHFHNTQKLDKVSFYKSESSKTMIIWIPWKVKQGRALT